MNKKNSAAADKFLQGLLRVSKSEQDRSLSPIVRQALGYIPPPTTYQLPAANTRLLSSEKVLLTRKANEFFCLGRVREAEKIYLTVGYSSGLHKLAEHYFHRNNFLKAYLLFRRANDCQNAEALTERFVAVVRQWLQNSDK